MSTAASSSRRRVPRTVIAGAIIIASFALIAFFRGRRPHQEADLIEQIKAAGGFVTTEPPPSLKERLDAYRSGSGWLSRYTAVGLYGSDVTGDWLREHHDLNDLEITDLKMAETSLTGDDLARFVAAHPLHVLQLRAQPLNDSTIDALADCRELVILELRDSPIADAQFNRLPVEQFEELRIDGTQVTTAGLRALQPAKSLVVLTLDGRQFDADAAKLLSRLPALRHIELVGKDVTDEHVQRLQAFAALESVVLTRTQATDDGVKALEAALPNCLVTTR